MKRGIFFLYILVSTQLAFAQIQSSCTDNAVLIANAYEKEIQHLAIQRMYWTKHPDTSKIILPLIHKDSVLQALTAVFNLGTHLQADSVFNRYCIHDYLSQVDSIIVKIDTNVAWTSAWRQLQTTTTNNGINQLLNQYGFTVTNFLFNQYVTLYSPQYLNLNLYAFCDSLNTFAGVNISYPDPVIIFGGTATDIIQYRVENNLQKLDFYMEWDNGNIKKHWRYEIDNSCMVMGSDTTYFIQFSTEPYPVPVNCNLGPSTTNNFSKLTLKVYPNPTSTLLNISVHEKGEITIKDLTGRIVEHLTAENFSTTINISNQANGIYFLQFTNENGTAVQKIVKE